jgi:hypothetical protein
MKLDYRHEADKHRKVTSDSDLQLIATMMKVIAILAIVVGCVGIFVGKNEDYAIYGVTGFFLAFFLSSLFQGFSDTVFLLKKLADK